jgi:alpha-1,3-fucosyltransferase
MAETNNLATVSLFPEIGFARERIKQKRNRPSTKKCNMTLALFFLMKIMCVVFYFEIYDFENQKFLSSQQYSIKLPQTKIQKQVKNKTILVWNSPYRIETANFGVGHEPFIKQKCEISDCTVFYNKAALPLEDYDAVILHMALLWKTKLPDYERRQHQRFIFLTQESPASMPRLDVTTMGNYFNWTMTYELNSDILLLYGRIHPTSTAPKTLEETRKLIEATHRSPVKNYAANKEKSVAWMVTHCETPGLRESYVRQLLRFIPIDIYGDCGDLNCSRNTTYGFSDPKCYDMLETKYKFYLSFENSICDDYVTEKFFEIMNHDIVPVVYGGANYSLIAPPHSYIDALQYTPETLAQYLKVLDATDKLYNEYFWWKNHYTVESGVEQMARHGFCDLCKKLHEDEDVVKYYPESELVSRWHAKKRCTKSFSPTI